jgi:hypothetical protein
MKNDYVSTTTDVVPEPVKAAGPAIVEEQTKKLDESEAAESGVTAEIEAQDAVETDLDTEADDTEVDAGDEDQKEEIAKPKKKGGFQKKLEKQGKELEYWRELALKNQQQEKPVEKMEKPVAANGDDPEPDANKYDSLTDLYKDHSRWAARQELSAYEKKQQEKASQQKAAEEHDKKKTKHWEREENYAKSVGDYVDVVSPLRQFNATPGLYDAIISSDQSPELLYHFGNNYDELVRINGLDYGSQIKEIAKLEFRLAKSEEQKPEVKTKTAAPPPPKPVGTKSPGKAVKDPNDMSFEEHKAWRSKNK